MAENTQTPESTETQVEVKPNRFKTLMNNHPRATKVAAVVGGVALIGVVAEFMRSKSDGDTFDPTQPSDLDPSTPDANPAPEA